MRGDILDHANNEYVKFGQMCRELVVEAKRLNVDECTIYNGVSWNFNKAYENRVMSIFEIR